MTAPELPDAMYRMTAIVIFASGIGMVASRSNGVHRRSGRARANHAGRRVDSHASGDARGPSDGATNGMTLIRSWRSHSDVPRMAASREHQTGRQNGRTAIYPDPGCTVDVLGDRSVPSGRALAPIRCYTAVSDLATYCAALRRNESLL